MHRSNHGSLVVGFSLYFHSCYISLCHIASKSYRGTPIEQLAHGSMIHGAFLLTHCSLSSAGQSATSSTPSTHGSASAWLRVSIIEKTCRFHWRTTLLFYQIPLIFFSTGGSGITPMLQIARDILSNPNDKTKVNRITILYRRILTLTFR